MQDRVDDGPARKRSRASGIMAMTIARKFWISIVFAIVLATVAVAQQPPAQRPLPRDGFPTGPRAQILSFTASPTSVQPGQSVTLKWAAVNADRVMLDRNIGVVTARGSRKVTPGVTTTYTLTAVGFGGPGKDTRSVTITVPGTTPAPPESTAASASSLSRPVPRTAEGK